MAIQINPKFSGLVGIGVAALITISLSSALHVRTAMGDKPSPRVPLTVEPVIYTQQDHYDREVSYLGLITAGRKANLGFEVPGTVAELPWREGSPVAKGEIIARLDDAALRASYRATEGDLDQARSELELGRLKARRQQELRETGAVSREAFDETRLRAEALESRVVATEARLHSIAIQLEKASLRAPYDGIIGDRFIHEGAVVNPGSPVVHFIETAGREANIGVTVTRARALVPGQEYTLTLRGQTFNSPLLTVRPDVDPVTRVTTAVFSLPEDIDAVDGEPVSLLLSESVPSIGGWLPIASLLEGNRGLWTVLRLDRDGDIAVTVREAVEVVEIRGDQAFVHGTLADGTEVVASGVHRITPGTVVSVGPASTEVE
ncbi:efflux RND transporter periplasmic adaptor subunit [Halioglobus maricola]|uniref:Efflux RND transporter periplasmic adaptor subunit n=1 Tax=Halioglobus maricola TaxID=2601894 RepID=A0A5P9NK71_9GAMM|nr:efflux RND transporter periplasmic adaptor subunit [Halioglobus maricola]QFU76167.1 efflux RND transporter periplasmic adaptor subunit [Halioglobus maricola]